MQNKKGLGLDDEHIITGGSIDSMDMHNNYYFCCIISFYYFPIHIKKEKKNKKLIIRYSNYNSYINFIIDFL